MAVNLQLPAASFDVHKKRCHYQECGDSVEYLKRSEIKREREREQARRFLLNHRLLTGNKKAEAVVLIKTMALFV